jgi:hypothetical protein
MRRIRLFCSKLMFSLTNFVTLSRSRIFMQKSENAIFQDVNMLEPDQNGNSEANTNIDNLLVNKQGLYINITGTRQIICKQ